MQQSKQPIKHSALCVESLDSSLKRGYSYYVLLLGLFSGGTSCGGPFTLRGVGVKRDVIYPRVTMDSISVKSRQRVAVGGPFTPRGVGRPDPIHTLGGIICYATNHAETNIRLQCLACGNKRMEKIVPEEDVPDW